MNNNIVADGSVIYHTDLSILRIFATISVIWGHVCSTLAGDPKGFQMTDMQSAFFNSADQMVCWVVPVFFMITGALLLDPDKVITVKDCVLKYCKRIILALMIFGIPFAVLKHIMENGGHGFGLYMLPLSVMDVLSNKSLGHLWYLYLLIGIYLMLPVFRMFVAKAEKSEALLVIIALIVMDFIIPIINRLLNTGIAFDVPLKYPALYLLLGWYLYKADVRRYKRLSVFSAIAAVVFIWVYNYVVDSAKVWVGFDSPLTLILTVSVFILIKDTTVENTGRLWQTDRLCFGVYLIHPLFIQFTYRYLKITPVNYLKLYPVVAVGMFFAFVIGAFAASRVLGKIKPLKKHVL